MAARCVKWAANSIALATSILAAGCSYFGFSTASVKPIEPAPAISLEPPTPSAIIAGAKTAAAAAKLTERLEVSAPIRSGPAALEPWIVCLRGTPKDEAKVRVYSVYFTADKYEKAQLSGVIDRCEDQNFSPLKN